MADPLALWRKGLARQALVALGSDGPWALRARCLIDLDELPAALAALSTAPDGAEAWILRARAGDPDAVELARRAAATGTNEGLVALGDALLASGNLSAARQLAERVIANRGRADAAAVDALGMLGRCAWAQDAHAAALQRFQQAAVLSHRFGLPRHEARWRSWVDVALVALNRHEQRIAAMEAYLAAVRRIDEPRWEAAVLLDRARSHAGIASSFEPAAWAEALAACERCGDAAGAAEAREHLG